jgi:hypothetical protein
LLLGRIVLADDVAAEIEPFCKCMIGLDFIGGAGDFRRISFCEIQRSRYNVRSTRPSSRAAPKSRLCRPSWLNFRSSIGDGMRPAWIDMATCIRSFQ